jgi:DNA-binding response OmpR family regulator
VRILIVEDEFLLASAWAGSLQAAGYEPHCAASIQQAFDSIAASPPDICTLDANVRGASSEPVAAELARRGIPFIVVSGFPASAIAGALAGARFLKKPLRSAALVRALDDLRVAAERRPAGADRP